MKCRICNNKFRKQGASNQHVHEPSHVDGTMCLGCWMAQVDLELFLSRAKNFEVGVMGDWTSGWLKAIIEDPRKYLK